MTSRPSLLAAAIGLLLSVAACKKPGDLGSGGAALPAGTDAPASAGAAFSTPTPQGTVGGGTTNDTSSTATGGAQRSGGGSTALGEQAVPAAGSTSGATISRGPSLMASAPSHAAESDPARTRNAAAAALAAVQSRAASASAGTASSARDRP